jgi:nanoRNase/pAp phosphatase (c-di-AMP/oligoRNAs hydrolase)
MLDFLKSLRRKRVLLLLHSLADLDSLGSAIALKSYFKNAKIATPDAITAKSKKLLKFLNARLDLVDEFDFDAIIILDTSSYHMLSDFSKRVKEFKGEIGIIDHHSIHEDSIRAEHLLIDNNSSSTCEITYEILKELGLEIDEKTAVCLLTGIIQDSASFRNASKKTFNCVVELLEKTKLEYEDILEIISTELDISERIALLKVCQRAEIIRVGNFLIAKSTIGSFEAAAAESLISLGADFAFVGSKSSSEARISGRMREELAKELGINLATNIMFHAGKILKGSGGGHPAAAGANGPSIKALEEALDECVTLTKKRLLMQKSL